jgi:hypothetical protein
MVERTITLFECPNPTGDVTKNSEPHFYEMDKERRIHPK